MFLIVLAASLLLGGVTLAVKVVDALAQVLLVELEVEIASVDLSVIAGVVSNDDLTGRGRPSCPPAAAELVWRPRAGEHGPC